MFTGLIKDLGTVLNVIDNLEGKKFEIKTSLINDIGIDDSVAVNGCCLTTTTLNLDSFFVQAVNLTLSKTSLGNLVVGSKVNLELAMKLSDRLGGHLVQGHVNDIAILKDISSVGENYHLWFKIPEKQMKYIILEGSICLSGISLTVADIKDDLIMVTIIPHTWQNTNLSFLNINETVNLEVDMMAKYLENFSKYDAKEL
jgi:riboflavin synthase